MTSYEKFTVKKKNLPIIDFILTWDELGQLRCNIDIFIDDKNILPYALNVTGKNLLNWLKDRFIPENRSFSENILVSLLHSSEPKLVELLKATLGLSLNDDYWIVPYNSNYKWSNYNLYSNGFSQELSLAAFTGKSSIVRGIVKSPEPTTNGVLPKCWRRINKKIYLYKGGTEGYANAGKEPYSEYYAYQIANEMVIDAVEYNLRKWKEILCSTCELFTSEDKSFIPAYKVYGNTPISNILKQETESLRNKLVDMMIFDSIIVNEDRHFNNFGFIRDNDTGKIVDMAPVFDNGVSLLSYAMDDDLADLENYLMTRQMTFEYIGADQISTIKSYMTDRNREAVRKLTGFEFKKHTTYNLDEKRLKVLVKLINDRARQLL